MHVKFWTPCYLWRSFGALVFSSHDNAARGRWTTAWNSKFCRPMNYLSLATWITWIVCRRNVWMCKPGNVNVISVSKFTTYFLIIICCVQFDKSGEEIRSYEICMSMKFHFTNKIVLQFISTQLALILLFCPTFYWRMKLLFL